MRWNSSYNGTNFATGSSYTFIPTGSNSSNITHTFTAVCEGSNLCRSINSASISVVVKYKPSQPTIFGPGTSICANSSVTLTASACSGGTLGWTGNRSGSSITFNLTGSINIKTACTINGCTSDSSNVYSISSLPKPNILTVNSSQVQALCYGSSVTLTANACVGTVKWTGNLSGSPITVTPLSSRNYKASCLSSNGCSSDSSAALNIVVLPKTKPTISGNTFVCGISSVTLTASGCSGANETVVWRDESTGVTFTQTISQTKTFRVVCIRNGYCVSDSSDIFTVQYRVKPSQPTITPPANTTICQGTSVSLTASTCAGGTLGWTGGLSGQTISVSPSTTKSYKVACVINGCVSDSSLAVSLTVKSKPTQPIINQISPTICAGQNTVLSIVTVNGAFYNWTGGLSGTSISVSPSITKTYKVIATVNGCVSDSASVVISVNALPTAPSISLGGEICTNVLPAKIWDNLISTPSGCSVNSLLNTIDGGTFTVIQEQSSIKIAKINSSGTVIWSRYLSSNNIAYRIPQINTAISTNDGGFLLGGKVAAYAAFGDANFISILNSQFGLATEDFWVLKIDANGVTQWSKNYGGNSEDVINKIEKTSDGGYLLGGTTNSSQGFDVTESGSYAKDYWIVKIDAIGNKLWDKRFSSTAPASLPVDKLNSLKVLNNGDFLIGGSNYNGGAYYNYHVIRVNDLGTKLWENYYGMSNSNSLLVDIETFSDNSIILSGSTTVALDQDIWLVKINDSGIKLWDKFIGTNGLDDVHTVLKIPNENNILLGARTYTGISKDKTEASKGGNDMWILKIKSDGTKIWDKTVGGSSDDYINKIALNSNSDIILGGFSSSAASGDKTINGPGAWFVKMASTCPPNVSSTICKGDSVSLKANSCIGTINWSNGSVGSTLFVKPMITTNFTATCTNSNGCISPLSSAFTVTVSTPSTPTITPPTNSTICQGSSITLSATGCAGGTFAWTGGLTGSSISVNPSATKAYKVACTLNTCTSDSSLAVMVNITPAPVFSLNSTKTSICAGDSATLTISGCTGSILWSNGATTSMIKVSPAINTTYRATCVGSPCSSTQSVSITVLSAPSVTASGLLQCGQTVTLTANNVPAGSTIQWRKDGTDIVGATNGTVVVNSVGGYDFTSALLVNSNNVGNTTFNKSIIFLNEAIGFVGNTQGIFKTIDGGTNWSIVYNSGKAVNSITFLTSLIGFAVGEQGFVYKTIDGGNTWDASALASNSSVTFEKIKFKDFNNGIIVGGIAEIYYTNDGGVNWQLSAGMFLPNPPYFKSISFVPNSSVAYVVGSTNLGGVILKSNNNGVSWSEVTASVSTSVSSLNDIAFISANNGLIVGVNGTIFKTSNGGLNWQLQTSNTTTRLVALQYMSDQVAYICGSVTLLKTIDGGDTWKSLNSIADANSLFFISEYLGWLTNFMKVTKYTTPRCPTIPKVIPNNCCNGLETLKSGSWTDPATWSCNRVPTSTDDIFINTGHTITDIGNTIHAKTLNYRGGILQLSTTTNFILR